MDPEVMAEGSPDQWIGVESGEEEGSVLMEAIRRREATGMAEIAHHQHPTSYSRRPPFWIFRMP